MRRPMMVLALGLATLAQARAEENRNSAAIAADDLQSYR